RVVPRDGFRSRRRLRLVGGGPVEGRGRWGVRILPPDFGSLFRTAEEGRRRWRRNRRRPERRRQRKSRPELPVRARSRHLREEVGGRWRRLRRRLLRPRRPRARRTGQLLRQQSEARGAQLAVMLLESLIDPDLRGDPGDYL